MPANAQRIANGMIVVSQHRKNSVGSVQLAQALGGVLHIPKPLVNKIAGQCDQVGRFGLHTSDHVAEI